jgi:recombinational DNA repair ATPase RecF
MESGIRGLVLSRLEAEGPETGAWRDLALAALDGREALEAELTGRATASPRAAAARDTAAVAGAFLERIEIEGFRGIGPRQALELRPGPGLTLVVGRNGSGKSSFAEGVEVLLTGDSLRFKERAAVWREGWRNLHHPHASLRATFVAEGERGPCAVTRRWAEQAAFEAGEAAAERHGAAPVELAALGWSAALRTHRPFLSYNELGSLLDEGPSKLYDALSSILGLEDLVQALQALQEARREREKLQKEVADARGPLLEKLRGVADERARRAVGGLEGKDPDLDAVEAALAGLAPAGTAAAETDALRGIAGLEPPERGRLEAAASEMRASAAALSAARETAAARARDAAALVESALAYHAAHGDGDCPVCGRKGALDAKWSRGQREAGTRLREAAREADAVHQRADAARRLWESLVPLKPEALARAGEAGLDLAPLVTALSTWVEAGAISDLAALADHVERASGPLEQAILRLRDSARVELARREDAWRPAAVEVAAWLARARAASRAAEDLKGLKAAEAWFKKAAASIRDERFAPIAEKSARIWEHLRQQSHVELGRIQLTGEGTRRRVALDVTVDGVEGAALGVMSQGELHSLALSLFIPRATLEESPFRFIVVDDPVQSMDPARVDGLARVLETASADRQVVVFTHDDRLPEAVRRLDIAAEVVEVTRRDASVVELRRALDPVGRYLEDALAVAGTADLPSSAAGRVVPGLCRLGLEAACMEVVRRRRLGRGEPHAEVERLLADAAVGQLAALALFDDAGRGAEVLARVAREAGAPLAETLRQCEAGPGVTAGVAPIELARQSSKLVAWLRGLR